MCDCLCCLKRPAYQRSFETSSLEIFITEISWTCKWSLVAYVIRTCLASPFSFPSLVVALQELWRAGAVESSGWLGKAFPCHASRGKEDSPVLQGAVWSQHGTLPEVWLTDRPNSCSGDTLLYFGTWVLLKYKGLMFAKGEKKHVCINERKSRKKFSWYLGNIFSSICQIDWHFRHSY